MRILVVIASYGSQNDQYLEKLITEYRSMPYRVDIVVLSNIPRNFGSEIEVRVGLPIKNPWSLPFGHKRIFFERINQYDLFIYSEDDVLITVENIKAFLDQSAVLPSNQIPGFLRIEKGANERIQYCDMHASSCWDSQSVETIAGYTFAYFSNEHAACYILTRQQLQRAIASGGFLVPPHEGTYDMLCSAATDPYTQCGFRKMICISDLDASSVHHMSNKYFHRFGLSQYDLESQINTLLRIGRDGVAYEPLIQMEPRLKGGRYLRDHYEPVRTEILSLIGDDVRSILSFGCGETEIALAASGRRVVAVPVDSVVSAAAEGKGVELVLGDLAAAMAQLHGQTFDCVLFLNVLHLTKRPSEVITSFLHFLKEGGVAVTLTPYISGLRFLEGWLTRGEGRRSYRQAGINITSPGLVRKWLKHAGASPEKPIYISRCGEQSPALLTKAFMLRFLAKEFIIRARKGLESSSR